MEKKLKFIIIVLFLFNYGYSQSFNVGALSYKNNSIIIDEEVVTFYDEYLSSKYIILNTSKEKVLLQMEIECIPEPYGGGTYSDTLIPYNYQILDNENEIPFFINNNGNMYLNTDNLNKQTSIQSYIQFILTFNPMERKALIIKYSNESENFHHTCDTGIRRTVRYNFNKTTPKKTILYVPNDNNIKVDNGLCLFDFLFKKDNSYYVENNLNRLYEKNFIWEISVPSNIYEVVCREDFFCPTEDWSILHLYYEVNEYLNNTLTIFLGNKNLTKEKLSKSDLFTLSKKQLSILRNSFYAKYGYDFKNPELREYFETNCKAQGITYKVNPNFSESVFNEVERKNIELIKEMENMKEPILLSDLQ